MVKTSTGKLIRKIVKKIKMGKEMERERKGGKGSERKGRRQREEKEK